MMKKTIAIKLNVDLRGKKAGDTVTCEVDRDGVIVDQYWRRRVAEAEIDKCVTVVKGAKA